MSRVVTVHRCRRCLSEVDEPSATFGRSWCRACEVYEQPLIITEAGEVQTVNSDR